MRMLIATVLTALLLVPGTIAAANEGGPTPNDIAFVQGLLKRFGYDPGPIDGICGDLTVAAVREFHSSRDLPLKPGDVEPQAATVVENLTIAFSNAILRPEKATVGIYHDALSGDADAALAVGTMYHRGESVAADKMLAFTWWSVAEANGDKRAARMKSDLTDSDQISEHEVSYAKALAKQILESSQLVDEEPSQAVNEEPPSATM